MARVRPTRRVDGVTRPHAQACCVYRRRKDDPVAEVNGMEMGEVTVIESAPEATVKAVEVPPPPVEGTPNPVRAEGEMI